MFKSIALSVIALSNLTGLSFDSSVKYEINSNLSHESIYQYGKEIDETLMSEDDLITMNNHVGDNDYGHRIVIAYLIDELTGTYLLTDGGGDFYDLTSDKVYTNIENNQLYMITVENNRSDLSSIMSKAEIKDIDMLEVLNDKEFIDIDIMIGREMMQKKVYTNL